MPVQPPISRVPSPLRARRAAIAWAAVLAACAGGGDPPPTDAGDLDAAAGCRGHSDCDDGLFCNGPERCQPGDPRADALGCVLAEGPPCPAGSRCDEAAGRCGACLVDADGDGALARECGGSDCDDADPERYPGAPEICDPGRDEDCDPSTVGLLDADGDGVIAAACCNAVGAAEACGADCDDALASVRPGAVEACNDRDDDCDGSIDEGVLVPYWPDTDRDLYGDAAAAPVFACRAAPGYVPNALDCDDTSARRHPGAGERCDGTDDDCNGSIDDPEPTAAACAAAYGSPAFTTFECSAGACAISGCTAERLDCNGRLDDGCEVDRTSSVEHCGACARSCGAGGSCAAGACDPIVALRSGQRHSCVTRASGRVACWGYNGDGELGDRTVTTRSDPVVVAGLPDVAVAEPQNAGLGHDLTCALAENFAFCWGDNQFGALGDGTTTQRLDPTLVVGFPPPRMILTAGVPVQIASSGTHTCGLALGVGAGARVLWCWGSNASGQLGRGSITGTEPAPAPCGAGIPALGAGARVAVGRDSTCVLTRTGGEVWCVGEGSRGQLGRGSTAGSTSWARAAGLSGIVDLDGAGIAYCAVDGSGGVLCWGAGFDAGAADRLSPAAVPGAGPAARVEVGYAGDAVPVGCALRTDRTVACWGGNADGNLGRGTVGGSSAAPAAVPGLSDVHELSMGGFFACARRGDGSVWCWGDDAVAELGNASVSGRSGTPVQVDRLGPYSP